jgi:hypothetical protein
MPLCAFTWRRGSSCSSGKAFCGVTVARDAHCALDAELAGEWMPCVGTGARRPSAQSRLGEHHPQPLPRRLRPGAAARPLVYERGDARTPATAPGPLSIGVPPPIGNATSSSLQRSAVKAGPSPRAPRAPDGAALDCEPAFGCLVFHLRLGPGEC